MSWNKQTATDRVRASEQSMPVFELTRLTRLMNLGNITLSKPKTVEGVHLYVAICDEAAKITEQLDVNDREGPRIPLRAVHLWQREVSRIIASDFEAAKVHFQGTRVHILVYRPVGSPAELCQPTSQNGS